MIARTWHGVVPVAKADEYYAYLLRTGIPDYQATSGNRGVNVLRRVEHGYAHFLLVSFWDSVEAIKAFAGDEIERAYYYPEDEALLVELEPYVTHYEVLIAAPIETPAPASNLPAAAPGG